MCDCPATLATWMDADASVTFSQTIESAFDGCHWHTSVVSFRSEGADEKSYTFSNFNSDAGELLFDDGWRCDVYCCQRTDRTRAAGCY